MIDEPLTRGLIVDGPVSRYCSDLVIAGTEITALAPALKQLAPRTVEAPSDDPLVVAKSWSVDRKLRYLHARRANATQIHRARNKLGFSKSRAFAINLQRALECCDFQPRRQWQYYPVIDDLLGSGVPRSQAGLPSLTYPEVAFVGYSGELLCSQGIDTVYRIEWGT